LKSRLPEGKTKKKNRKGILLIGTASQEESLKKEKGTKTFPLSHRECRGKRGRAWFREPNTKGGFGLFQISEYPGGKKLTPPLRGRGLNTTNKGHKKGKKGNYFPSKRKKRYKKKKEGRSGGQQSPGESTQ